MSNYVVRGSIFAAALALTLGIVAAVAYGWGPLDVFWATLSLFAFVLVSIAAGVEAAVQWLFGLI